MKKTLFLSLCAALSVLTLVSCSKKLDERLPGPWFVVEATVDPVADSASVYSQVGDMNFSSGGTGSYSLTFSENDTYSGDLTWVVKDEDQTITVTASAFTFGTFAVVHNSKEQQVWQRTDTNGTVYTYTLQKVHGK